MLLLDRQFRTFMVKLFLFLLPFLLLIGAAVVLDPFKAFYEYDDYYKDNFVTHNRGLITFKVYEKNRRRINYDAFILGSSRSWSFRVKKWEQYLPPGAKGFHFDASGEGIFGIYTKLRYIDQVGGKIRNALILVDLDTLTTTSNRKGVLFVSPPKLSGDSTLEYYLELLKPLTNSKFLVGYLDYSLFGVYRGYMAELFNNTKYEHRADPVSNDFYIGYERMIQEDESGYYQRLAAKGVFYDRRGLKQEAPPVTTAEVELLKKIQALLIKHGTDYRIIVSPCYDQVPLDQARRALLSRLFGRNVHDFSGANSFTGSIRNYYESSHYRPHVADQIMELVYVGAAAGDRPLSRTPGTASAEVDR